jgi:hypothetical protein
VQTNESGDLVLVVKSTTPRVIRFDHPRYRVGNTRFTWLLASNAETVADSSHSQLDRDPLMPFHVSSGPIDIDRDRPLICNLADYFPELTNRSVLARADSFVWYCRIRDETKAQWVQDCGVVPLK